MKCGGAVASLAASSGPVSWRPLTKDGAPVPAARAIPGPAVHTIAVGETYDFEFVAPPGRQTLWLEIKTPAGRWHVQGRVALK
jgi:hypothetical protein